MKKDTGQKLCLAAVSLRWHYPNQVLRVSSQLNREHP